MQGATTPEAAPPQGPEQERLNRNLGGILQELRISLPAVQMLLALAMSGALLLVTDILFGTLVTVLTFTGAMLMFVMLWGVIPVRRREKTLKGPARRS